MLDGKKVIILGDRDGVPAPAIEQCLSSLNVEVVFSSTECFV
jgi:glycine/sarcosine/betaine reductase complex component A